MDGRFNQLLYKQMSFYVKEVDMLTNYMQEHVILNKGYALWFS